MNTAYETVNQFVTAYKEKLDKLNESIETTYNRMEELKQEVGFIQTVELPQAVEIRVMHGDTSLENKVKKSLDKAVAELQQREEELIVFEGLKFRFLQDSADKLKEIQPLLRDEKTAVENTAFARMMVKKRELVEAIINESESLHQYANLDMELQRIEVNAGRRNSAYPIVNVNTAPIPNHVDRHNGVYLQLTNDEIKKLVLRKFAPDELNYLDKFKHEKAL